MNSIKKKVAIFSKPGDLDTLRVLYFFYKKNFNIALIVNETGIPEYKNKYRVITWELMRKRQRPNIIIRNIQKILNKFGIKYSLNRRPERELFNTLSLKEAAEKINVKVEEVLKHSSADTRLILEKNNISYVLLVSSNYLIKEPLLSMEDIKIINAHCAKLPEHRSLDSLPWSVLEGDKIGLTTHFVDSGIDTGDILLFKEVIPDKDDDLVSLRMRIDSYIPEIFYNTIKGLIEETITPEPQYLSAGKHHQPMNEEEFMKAEQELQKRIKEIYGR